MFQNLIKSRFLEHHTLNESVDNTHSDMMWELGLQVCYYVVADLHLLSMAFWKALQKILSKTLEAKTCKFDWRVYVTVWLHVYIEIWFWLTMPFTSDVYLWCFPLTVSSWVAERLWFKQAHTALQSNLTLNCRIWQQAHLKKNWGSKTFKHVLKFRLQVHKHHLILKRIDNISHYFSALCCE